MARIPYMGNNGAAYEVVKAPIGQSTYQWFVYDSAGGLVRQGYVTTGYNDAVIAAKAYIDGKDIGDIEYQDLPKPIPMPVQVDPIQPIGVVYPHTMYDCATGKGYQARNRNDHEKYEKMGFVHDLSECPVSPPGNGDNAILETAGVFVVGVAKGTLIAAVPITAMAVAVGFMRRIVRFGVGVSS